MLNKIKRYCLGKSRLSYIQEKQFLADSCLQDFTGVNLSKNSGKISEWYVCQLLKDKGIEFISIPFFIDKTPISGLHFYLFKLYLIL